MMKKAKDRKRKITLIGNTRKKKRNTGKGMF
jgi:hypothetical protein